jgi:UDP-2,3-diacylglucosamine pyrophosphatase LpxH
MDHLLHALDSARYRKDSLGAASASGSLSVRSATCKTPESGSEVADAIIISDLHLGSENSQARLITQFLESLIDQTLRTRRLIINGDVFDSIDFRRLKKTHWKVLSTLRHLSDKLEVIWTCGNHDGPAEIVSHLLGVEVHEEYVFHSGDRRIMVLHGHRFDDFIDDHPVLTWIADVAYNTLQKIDRRHYVARLAKSRSKTFLHCLEKVEHRSTAHARHRHCDVVICGHTHHAVSKCFGDVRYVNSGCWTELPATWLAVHDGEVRIHKYHPAASIKATLMPLEDRALAVAG